MHNLVDRDDRSLRVGSLFSGYGGLDLAVEHVFNAETVWFSDLNEPVARVFAHHWPDAPNLGDITTIDWREVEPVDILTGGFPCQSVSTVGKRAGLAPGAASGLWSHMAAAIEALQPRLVVIENVRGLLSTPAQRTSPEGADHAHRNPGNATPEQDAAATLRDLEPDPWHLGDDAARLLRAAGAVLRDLVDLWRDARGVGLPASLVGAPHHRFRIFILAHLQYPVPRPADLGLLPAAGRAWNRSEPDGARSRCRTRSSTSPRTDPMAHRASTVSRRHCGRLSRTFSALVTLRRRHRPMGTHHWPNSPDTSPPERRHWTTASTGVRGVAHGPPRRLGHRLWTQAHPNQQTTALGNGVLLLQAEAALTSSR